MSRHQILRVPFLSSIKAPLTFYVKVGYVSQRFFKSSFLSVKMFFETNTFPLVPQDLPKLSSIASFFGAELRSVCLSIVKSSVVEDILEFTSIVTHLKAEDSSFLPHLLDHSSSIFLSRLRVLDVISKPPGDTFTSFCNSLMVNTTVLELLIDISDVSSNELFSFKKVFWSNNTLKKLTLSSKCIPRSLYEECQILFQQVSTHSTLELIDLSNFDLKTEISNVIVTFLQSISIRSVVFPKNCNLDSSISGSLNNNSSLRDLTFSKYRDMSELFVTSLMSHSKFKKLTFLGTRSMYIISKGIESNTSVLELSLFPHSEYETSIDKYQVESLSSMLQRNTTLLVLNLQVFS
ncbi:hypothetical protein GEMRC1_009670 [Eukaryota sp. GEM-RC1]